MSDFHNLGKNPGSDQLLTVDVLSLFNLASIIRALSKLNRKRCSVAPEEPWAVIKPRLKSDSNKLTEVIHPSSDVWKLVT